MGLISQNSGQGDGIATITSPQVQNGVGIMGQISLLKPHEPGMVGSAVTLSPGSSFGVFPTVGSPRFNFHSQRHGFCKLPGIYFRKYGGPRHNGTQIPVIDLKKPWVTEEVICEETKSQELLELWKKTRTTDSWTNFVVQREAVQALFNKAKNEYAASHPEEAALWRDTPSKRKYFCETCDKSFRTSDDFLLHKAEHETCGREGCEFTAHPKIIAKHIKMQHESGLYKRIGKLYTEEDISKWIEERKKHYPTRKLVEEKKILEEEKLKRGEKIKEDKSKFNKSFINKDKTRGKKNFERRNNKISRNKRKRKKKSVSLVVKCLEEETSVRTGVPAFLGIKTISEPEVPEIKDFDVSDEEWETEGQHLSIPKPMINSSLGLLAMSYDSDVDDSNIETKAETMSVDEGSGPDEVSSKNPILEQKLTKEKVSFKRKSSERKGHHKRKRISDNPSEKRSLTLLEKLLKNEIRQERNIILQCVHYVIKNNFFKT